MKTVHLRDATLAILVVTTAVLVKQTYSILALAVSIADPHAILSLLVLWFHGYSGFFLNFYPAWPTLIVILLCLLTLKLTEVLKLRGY